MVDQLVAVGVPREYLRDLADMLRQMWQAGFDAAGDGAPDVMRDYEQIHRAVIAGIRCYRSHHPYSAAALALKNCETESLAKRIVGNLKSLAKGCGFVQFDSRSQLKQRRKRERE